MRAWLNDRGPIGNMYGKPHTELIIMQIEPTIASGCPPVVGPPGGITVMFPLSGGPDEPGDKTTEHPIVTGGPGIFLLRKSVRSPAFRRKDQAQIHSVTPKASA